MAYKMTTENFATKLALQGRGLAIKRLSMTVKLTPSKAAELLTNHAIELGLVEPRSSIHGKTLDSWSRERDGTKIQFWAAVSAIDLLIKLGWVPKTSTDWAMWSIAVAKIYNNLDDREEVINSMGTGFNVNTSKVWLKWADIEINR